MTQDDRLIRWLEELIDLGSEAIDSAEVDDDNEPWYVDEIQFRRFKASSLNALLQLFGDQHHMVKEFKKEVTEANVSKVEIGLGILSAAYDNLKDGHLTSFKSLVTSEVFTDFLEMAEHLLKEGYKDPAAVLIGGVLEDHLRKLCLQNEIVISHMKGDKGTPLKADRLNAELAKSGVYGKQDLKAITAMLDLRNLAAHGHYGEFSGDQVNLMLQGVISFISRVPLS